MYNCLFLCPKCHKVFRFVDSDKNYYITDYNDKFPVNENLIKCLCGNIVTFDPVICQDWIADKVFSVKGY